MQIRLAGVAIQEETRRGRRCARGLLDQADPRADPQSLSMALRGTTTKLGFSDARAGRVGDERMMDWLGCLLWWLCFRRVGRSAEPYPLKCCAHRVASPSGCWRTSYAPSMQVSRALLHISTLIFETQNHMSAPCCSVKQDHGRGCRLD